MYSLAVMFLWDRDALRQLIANRVGTETFFNKLGIISKHEGYTQAAHKPQLRYRHPSEIFFDYEFCRLFKSLEGKNYFVSHRLCC